MNASRQDRVDFSFMALPEVRSQAVQYNKWEIDQLANDSKSVRDASVNHRHFDTAVFFNHFNLIH